MLFLIDVSKITKKKTILGESYLFLYTNRNLLFRMSKYFSDPIVENSLYFMLNQRSRFFLFRIFSLPLFLFLMYISQNQSSVAWHSLIYWINIDFSFGLQMSHPGKAEPHPFLIENSRYSSAFDKFNADTKKKYNLFY